MRDLYLCICIQAKWKWKNVQVFLNFTHMCNNPDLLSIPSLCIDDVKRFAKMVWMNNALQWHLEIFGNNYFSRLDRILPRMASYDRVSRCTTNTNRLGSDRQSIKCHTNWTRMKYVDPVVDLKRKVLIKCIIFIKNASCLSYMHHIYHAMLAQVENRVKTETFCFSIKVMAFAIR